MSVSFSIMLAIIVLLFIILIFFIFLFVGKNETVEQLKSSLDRLSLSFNDLDEQAQLIVKTDLELNRAQEELDKRLNGLDALNAIVQMISTTLDENEIFNRLSDSPLDDFGFERILFITLEKNNDFFCRVNKGFSDEQIETILKNIAEAEGIVKQLREEKTFSSLSVSTEEKTIISKIFLTNHFILAPLSNQARFIGMVFFGNQSNASAVTEGDEEIITIMTNQVGQTLENAHLFEEVYKSSQALELKVQERTKQLESALSQVQKISKTKSEFISAVSHELRTPLTSIKGYASLLMTGKLGEIPESVKQRLEKINTHSDNLVALINNLLDISRIESGRVEMNISKHDLKHIIDNTHDLLTPQMTAKNIQWEAHIEEGIPFVFVDISHVERVFINLISNALKFTPEKGIISVTVKTETPSTLLVEVSDTGIGISQEDMNRLFDEFFRVENTINQNVKGTGLGLALVKKIVEAHGGRIWITSVINEGTTFHFTLPTKNPKTPGEKT